MPQPPCILIVDDDREVRFMVRLVLERAGYRTEQVENGLQAVQRCRENPPDLVVMDVMMPLLDGIEACRRIRAFSSMPVILFTVRDEEDMLVEGFSAGAYDFLTKPFRPRELLARVGALLKRAGPAQSMAAETAPAYEVSPPRPELPPGPPAAENPPANGVSRLTYADLSLDARTHEVRRGGIPLNLTANAFLLLLHFMRHPGEVIAKESLLRDVWGAGCSAAELPAGGGNMVEAAVKRLRKELGDDSRQPRYIKTVWGVGYRFGDGE